MRKTLCSCAAVFAVALLAITLSGCAGSPSSIAGSTGVIPAGNNSSTARSGSQASSSGIHTLDLALGDNTYAQHSARDLDSYDDSEWWTNGGSYGLVGGDPTNTCRTRVCPQSVISTPIEIITGGQHSRAVANCGTRACVGTNEGPGSDLFSNGRSKPASKNSGVQTMSLSFGQPHMDITCYYLEVTPGVMDPAHDTPLGCDYIDFGGNEVTGPGGGPGFDQGVHGGVGLPGSTCGDNTSMSIGQQFIPYNSNQVITVTGISSVWSNGTLVGWIYNGSDGNRYAGTNPVAEPSPVEPWNGPLMSKYFGFGAINPPPDTSIAQMASGQQPSGGAKALKCHTRTQG